MAHKAEKEETEFKAVVAPPSETVTCNASSAPSASPPSASSEKLVTFRSKRPAPENWSSSSESAKRETFDVASEATNLPPAKRAANRCSGCRRKVGLTGFRCRCGDLFCSEHRYSDRHDCGYDYKAAGRAAIARENPVVRAAKIVKI